MLTRAQRSLLFLLFCLFVIGCVVTEGFLFYSMVKQGFNNAKAVFAVLNGGVLFGCGRLFLEMVSRNFLKLNVLTPDRLHRFASERSRIIENARTSGQDEYGIRRSLVTSDLEFAEECLNGWVAGSHLELCVFVDREQPLLFAYFDSNHKTNSRSMGERELNPQFYLQKNYEVTQILQAPTSSPRFVSDAHDHNAHYAFTTSQQRDQVRSSILLCLDLEVPCALVVTSNAKNAFRRDDSEVISFIRFIGEMAHSDLSEGDFIRNIRKLKPKLFQVAPGLAI
jgi:hypothetical protein